MTNVWISPSYQYNHLASGGVDSKIDVFLDDIQISLIDQAKALFTPANPRHAHAGKAVLSLLLPYFETVAQYRAGMSSDNGGSKKFFRAEFLRIFPKVDDTPARGMDHLANEFYDQVRCGLMHSSTIKYKTIFSNRPNVPIVCHLDAAKEMSAIEVYPELFLSAVEKAFVDYQGELRNTANLDVRQKFEKFFDSRGL